MISKCITTEGSLGSSRATLPRRKLTTVLLLGSAKTRRRFTTTEAGRGYCLTESQRQRRTLPQRSTQVGTTLQSWIFRGLARYTNKDFTGAEADFDAAIERHHNDAGLSYHRGKARLRQYNAVGANADFTIAIQYGKDDAEVYARAAQLMHSGRTSKPPTRISALLLNVGRTAQKCTTIEVLPAVVREGLSTPRIGFDSCYWTRIRRCEDLPTFAPMQCSPRPSSKCAVRLYRNGARSR